MSLGEVEVKVLLDVNGTEVDDVEVTVDADTVIDQFTLKQLVEYLDPGDLLEEIGQDKAVEYFNLELAE